MNKKKKTNKGLVLLGVLFILYLIVLYAKGSGKFDYKEYNKMIITKEAMNRFEEDVKNGVDLSINEYINSYQKDYSNTITKIGAKIGEETKKAMTTTFPKIFKVLGKLFI